MPGNGIVSTAWQQEAETAVCHPPRKARQRGGPSTPSVQDQSLFRLYVSRGFNYVQHLTPLMQLMRAVGLMLRKGTLCAQPEWLQGQPGKHRYFGGFDLLSATKADFVSSQRN